MTRTYVLTTCHKPELLYGSTLVFDSLMTGIPDAALVVVDQSPDKVCAAEIKKKVEALDGLYIRPNAQVIHAEFLERTILPLRDTDEPLVIVDPDIVFWDKLQLSHPGVIAGRYLPAFPFLPGVLEAPRVHPSLWVIRSTKELASKLIATRKARHDFRPFHPTNVRVTWNDEAEDVHFDTGAALYSLVPQLFWHFEVRDLDRYDHLFLGAARAYIPDVPPIVERAHAAARSGNIASIKGIWREQEQALCSS